MGLWSLLLSTAILAAAPMAKIDLPTLAARVKQSVVVLTREGAGGRKLGTGTGFFISAGGRIVTNQHVIEGGERMTATLHDGRKVTVQGVLVADRGRDIAILQVEGQGYPPLSLGSTARLRPGDEVVVIGSPLGLSGTLSTGIVSALRDHGPGKRFGSDQKRSARAWGVQITAPVSPGSSGSPILTREGKVVAVAVGLLEAGQSLNFGIRIEVVKRLLAGLKADAKPKSFSSSSVGRNLLISAGVFAGLILLLFGVGRFDRRRRRRR